MAALGLVNQDEAEAASTCKPTCGECQTCQKGNCKKKNGKKKCAKGKCTDKSNGTDCSRGTCQNGTCATPQTQSQPIVCQGQIQCPAGTGSNGCCPTSTPNCCFPLRGMTDQDVCAPSASACCSVEDGGSFCPQGDVCCPPTLNFSNGACCPPTSKCCNTFVDCRSGSSTDFCAVGCCAPSPEACSSPGETCGGGAPCTCRQSTETLTLCIDENLTFCRTCTSQSNCEAGTSCFPAWSGSPCGPGNHCYAGCSA